MRYVLIAQLLILASVGFCSDQHASCELASKSIVSRSSSGIAQVSNLGSIQVRCRVPARPFPTTPGGEGRSMLKVLTAASQISPGRSKKPVPSEVHPSGGGSEVDPVQEWVDFNVHIPLEPTERDEEARRYLAKIEKTLPSQKITEEDRQRALERASEFVYQNRVGHFEVECRILDGDRVVGIGIIELEVLFKGRFSDVGLPGFSPGF